MDNLIFVILICIGIPLALSLLFLEKRSRLFVGYMIIGAYMCAFAAQVNTVLRDLSGESYLYVTTNITPVSEELLKALPVLVFALVINDNRRDLLSISIATGIGFAIIENIFIFVQNGSALSLLWSIQRVFGASLMHSLCTAMVGYGVSFARKRRKLFFPGTFALLVAAMVYHALYNTIVQSRLSGFAFLLPVLTYLPLAVGYVREKKANARKREAKIRSEQA